MAKKATNKKANIKDTVLDVEKTENVENTALDTENDEDTILGVEKKDSNVINEDGQNQTIVSEEVEQPKPTEDNAEIDTTTIYEKISEAHRIGKGQSEKPKENEDSQDIKPNSSNKVKTAKRKISKLFGYYWNGQLMD